MATAKKKVVVAPSGTKRLLDGDCEASGSKRYREQSESELATTVSESNKSNDCNNLLNFYLFSPWQSTRKTKRILILCLIRGRRNWPNVRHQSYQVSQSTLLP